jgi:cardiolipin synthase
VAAIALIIDGAVPAAVGIAVLAREAIVGVATLALAVAGAARIDVQWVGKAGTFALMFALPGFLLVDLVEPGTLHDVLAVVNWLITAGGLLLSYYAAARYVPLARDALRAGRETRAHTASEVTA